MIDNEIRKIVENGEKTARSIIEKNIDDLHTISKGLLEHETLTAEEINLLLQGKKVVKEKFEKKSNSNKPKNEKKKSAPNTGKIPNISSNPKPKEA